MNESGQCENAIIQMEIPFACGQRSLWFLHESEPGSAARSIAAALSLRGEVDISALERALDTWADEEPVRSLARGSGEWLYQHDAGDLDDAQLIKRLEYAAHESFDDARGPLLRVHLYRRSADETVILVLAHQIITDSWSMRTLVRELETLYFERTGGTPAAPDPAAKDEDFVRFYRWGRGPRG
jgi:Condensation domain